MKTYRGYRKIELDHTGQPNCSTCLVYVEDDYGRVRPLRLRLDVWNHSPTGFEWGYGGSGPAQLALALCLDALKDRKRAMYVYQAFKREVVCRMPHDGWALTHTEVLGAVKDIEDREKVGELGDESPEE